MQRVNDGAPVTGPTVAQALEVVVANIGDPTPELSLLGTSYPQWVMAVNVSAGADLETLYRLDLSSDPVNAPYSVPSALPGYVWSAVCGYAMNQATFVSGNLSAGGVFSQSTMSAVATVTSKAGLGAGIGLDNNGATGNFVGRLSPVPVLTGNRRYLFPDADISVVGSIGALTPGQILYVGAGGVVTGDVNFTRNAGGDVLIGTAVDAGDYRLQVFGHVLSSALTLGAQISVTPPLGTTSIDRETATITRLISVGPNAATRGTYRIIGASSDLSLFSEYMTMSDTEVLVPHFRFRAGPAISATSSITGALVVGDGVTVATSVGIGQGNIVAGGIISAVSATGTTLIVYSTKASVGGGGSADGCATFRGGVSIGGNGGVALSVADAVALRNGDATGTANFYMDVSILNVRRGDGAPGGRINAGVINIAGITPATSTQTGSLIVTDGTVGGSTGIGVGAIWTGGNLTVVNATNTRYITVDGSASGASGGAAFVVKLTGTNSIGLGNYSALNGGAFNGVPVLKVGPTGTGNLVMQGTLRIDSSTSAASPIAGALIVGDGVTNGTNVGIGGGNIDAGGTLTVAGQTGLGGATNSQAVLNVGSANPLTGTNQVAFRANMTGTVGGTVALRGLQFQVSTAAAVYNVAEVTGIASNPSVLGAGSTVTRAYGIRTNTPTIGGTCNIGLANGSVITETGNWFIYDNGTDPSLFGGSLHVRAVPYVWPAANAAGQLLNDGAGNLSWTPAGASAVAAFWAGIANAAHIQINTATALLANRYYQVYGTAADFDMTLPVAPADGTVVGLTVLQYTATANKAYRLDAGVGVEICGRTRYLTLVNTNIALLRWDGTRWSALVLCLDTPWIDAGATVLTATTTNPTKGTNTLDKVFWRRSGKDIHVRYEYRQTAAGANGSGSYILGIPVGAADTAVLPSLTTLGDSNTAPGGWGPSYCGGGSVTNTGTAAFAEAHLNTTTTVCVSNLAGGGSFNAWGSGSFGLGANAIIRFGLLATIPMTDW